MDILRKFRFDPNCFENREVIERVALQVVDSGANHDLIDKGARRLLESADGHGVVRDVILYTLAEPQTRAIILVGLGESFIDEHFRNDISARVDEARQTFAADLDEFKSKLNGDLRILHEKLLADADTASKGAATTFEASLKVKMAAAQESAQTKAKETVNSLVQ